ncbi:TPA: helix-turn-helix domain-containing protein [Streptococcus pneumoniae]|uniref:helix-turn-helix domain-containing protein n=1 Tax=Streptococcus pneumoniae TaxID=1313 RepID=UPI0005E2C035|nr:S24 family peptidase [Streptococcus pneumoniae]QBX12853.1 CI-like repressor [Streptococcus satellite phage Javan741]OEH36426.1 XRE family transcriptional regulator [Streptococcus pneumoniae]CKH12303.1 bifunctional S24 family peptidase/transcriptional regulator [Streptococcus pneumoniae]CKH31243.1 bifunctional S24 family peptidase/transcriptional regulator [Streptococcus pneumoniae]VJM10991.1 bifunctional S24 family peptidase/transcriptional regulator [Streptococcus pneumoniae]
MDNLAQHVGEKIKFFRKENGWTQSVLAEKMSTSKQTISKYEKGIIKVNQDTIFKLADIFGVSIDSFFPSIIEEIATTSPIQSIYDQLTPPRQEKALTYLKKQLLEQKNENIVSENIISLDDYRESKTLPVIGVVTAGNGITQDDNLNIEKCFYTDEIPDDYDAIAYVVGNSMEPKIKNGDYLFIKNTPQVDYNTIGIFQVDGANYVKKLRQGYLESLNPDCADIQLDESNDIRTIGEVVSIYREK